LINNSMASAEESRRSGQATTSTSGADQTNPEGANSPKMDARQQPTATGKWTAMERERAKRRGDGAVTTRWSTD
jgi:hypothetical protein